MYLIVTREKAKGKRQEGNAKGKRKRENACGPREAKFHACAFVMLVTTPTM